MQLTVLVDNNAGHNLAGEWGLSFFIETDDQKILFDLGASDLFLKNATRLKIDLFNLDYLVFSHGHYDHTWGLDYFIKYYLTAKIPLDNRPSVVMHPKALVPKVRNDGSEFGILIPEPVLQRNFKTQLVQEHFQLAENLFFLGEIPRKFDFEAQKSLGQTMIGGALSADWLCDDTALAYKSPKGLIIITGCSHSGICNIVEYAREICGEGRVVDIVGGFHLMDLADDDPQLLETLNYLNRVKSCQVHPCHCTDLQAKIAMDKVVHVGNVYSGLTLQYD